MATIYDMYIFSLYQQNKDHPAKVVKSKCYYYAAQFTFNSASPQENKNLFFYPPFLSHLSIQLSEFGILF